MEGRIGDTLHSEQVSPGMLARTQMVRRKTIYIPEYDYVLQPLLVNEYTKPPTVGPEEARVNHVNSNNPSRYVASYTEQKTLNVDQDNLHNLSLNWEDPMPVEKPNPMRWGS